MNAEGASRRCAKCGQPLAATATFCRSCGAARYTPPEPDVLAPAGTSEPEALAPAGTQSNKRLGRIALFVIGALVLVGASAGGTILLIGQDGSGNGGEQPAVSSVPADAGAAAQGSGEAVSGDAGSGLPPQATAAMAREIQSLLLTYYEDVTASRFREAWSLLSARKRRQNLSEYTYRDWVEEGVAGLADYLDPSGLTVRIDGTEADGSVRVLLTGMTWSDPNSSCSEWSGLTWVKFENGAWALDPGYSTTPDRRRLWEPREDELLGVGC